MPKLICKRVRFSSQADEWAFFQFVSHLPTVQRMEGVGNSIILHVRARPGNQHLRDLIALFERYRINGMLQLARFRTPANAHWFADPSTFWHQKVFGKTATAHGTSGRSAGSFK